MKRLLLLILLFFNSILIIADTSCHAGGNYSNLVYGNSINNGTYRVRIFFHIIRTTNGGGPYCFPDWDIQTCIQRLNSDYGFATYYDISFDYAGKDYIDNTDFYSITSYNSSESQLMLSTNSHPNAIDVYLLPTESSIAGFANGIPGTAIAIGGNYYGTILGSSSLLSHEIGHCLGLFHTYHGSSYEPYGCRELVSSNSTTCGDFVADTEADPFPLYDYITGCAWINTTLTDPDNGYLYIPDAKQIMADVPAECMMNLTFGQGIRVKTHIATQQILQNRITPMVAYVQKRQFFGNGDEIIQAYDTVIAGNNVTSGAHGDVIVPLGGDVIFEAGKEILLKPGFRVNLGGRFIGRINTTINNLNNSRAKAKENDATDTYIPLLENTSWTKIYHNIGDSHAWASIYNHVGDTIIDGKKYKIIKEQQLYVDEPTLYPHEEVCLLYEDIENKRVYMYSDFYKRDILLYDFSVQLGEKLPCDQISPSSYSDFILTDISPLENSNYTRRQYTFVHESDTIIWIEGIGNYNDFIRPHFLKMEEMRMLCVHNNDEIVYNTGCFLGKTCEDVNQIYENFTFPETTEKIKEEIPFARKILHDGQVLIERNNHTYTLTGTEVTNTAR